MSANIGNVAGGYKATLNNNNVSEEAKQNARDQLNNLESSGQLESNNQARQSEKNEGNVIGGHKANLNNPRTSEQAKEHSRQVLEDMDA